MMVSITLVAMHISRMQCGCVIAHASMLSVLASTMLAYCLCVEGDTCMKCVGFTVKKCGGEEREG